MKFGIIGSGKVGQTLATALLTEGPEVMLGTRDVSNPGVISWRINNPTGLVGYFVEAAAFGEGIVLAVKGSKVVEVVQQIGSSLFASKLVIDVTNPIADIPPINGVLSFFTGPNESLMEITQANTPDANVVEAFNSIGTDLMYTPAFNDGWPSMFICGNDDEAKELVKNILTSFGWDTEDMGKIEAARAIEPLCILWCIPGFIRNHWSHAFRLMV